LYPAFTDVKQSQVPANDYYGGADYDEEDDSDTSGYLLREKVVKTAWDALYDDSDHLLFCSRNTNVDLTALHPNQIHIFKLWQVYIENFDPLLKVTHTPTLQGCIINAASDLTNIDSALEALMFSIYCVAIFSLGQEECQKQFGQPREDLLSQYQLGAREALLSCKFLRTGDRIVLTALHFYLVGLGRSLTNDTLIMIDDNKARYRSACPIVHTWEHHTHRTTHGHPR
jgi:hypothetical protein